MPCGVVAFSSQLFALLESFTIVLRPKMKAPSFGQISVILRGIIDDHWRQRLFYQASLTTVTADTMCMARNTQLADVLYGTNFESIGCGQLWHWSSQCKRNSQRFRICERHHESPLIRAKWQWLNSLMIRSKTSSKYSWVAFLLWEFLTATNNALVELLKRTNIQVCISMLFNDYNMLLNVLSLSTLNSSF